MCETNAGAETALKNGGLGQLYDIEIQVSSHKKIIKGGGGVLRSKHTCCFSEHSKETLPQKGGSPLFPTLARILRSLERG